MDTLENLLQSKNKGNGDDKPDGNTEQEPASENDLAEEYLIENPVEPS